MSPGYVASVTTKIYEDVGLLDVISDYGPDLVSNRALYGILSGYLAQLDVLQNRLGTIQDAYYAYAYDGDTKVAERVSQLEIDLGTVTGLIGDMQATPLQNPPTTAIPQPASLDGTIPSLAFTLLPGPLWGGDNGIGNRVTYFDPSIVLGGNALTEVTINGGSEVNYLILSYGQLDPLHLGAPDGGSKGSQAITLQPQQFILSATATAEAWASTPLVPQAGSRSLCTVPGVASSLSSSMKRMFTISGVKWSPAVSLASSLKRRMRFLKINPICCSVPYPGADPRRSPRRMACH